MANGTIYSQSFKHINPGTIVYTNKPAGWNNSATINFGQNPVQSPPANDQIDNAIPGATGWNMIFFQQNWSKITDGAATESPVWRGRFQAGSWYEQHTVPSSPFQVTCNFPSNFGADVNLYDLTLDGFLTKVGSSPAANQYSVSGSGVYTFNSAQVGHSVLMAYTFANTVGLSGSTATGTPFGHGIGNVFNSTMAGTNRLYFSINVKIEFPDTSFWHTVSNKFVNIECNNSLVLMQLLEGGNWRHAEELGNPGFFIDPSHQAGQVDNRAVPINQYTQIEGKIDMGNRIYKIWQDGILTTDATPTFTSTSMTTFGVNSHRGGGGETLAADIYYNYDNIHIAW